MNQRKALGKGLEALFGPTANESAPTTGVEEKNQKRRILSVKINDIIPNPNQPRERFSDDAMNDLKASIAENGILEPPIVRRKGDFFELIAGERRFRAAKDLGHETIDVILMDVESDQKMLVLSLIENIQRENLNAIEEAKAYQQISDKMSLTQEELSLVVGKNRSTVANMMRLLSLPSEIQNMITEGSLAPGSARALVTVQDRDIQYKLAVKIATENLSARKAEELVKSALTKNEKKSPQKPPSPFIQSIRENLQRSLGTGVKITGSEHKGKIEIEYFSREDLERIIESFSD